MSYRSFIKALETYQCNNQKFMPQITDEGVGKVSKGCPNLLDLAVGHSSQASN